MKINFDFSKMSIHRKISYYLIFSYLYYEKDDGIISDHQYDDLCKNLFENFDQVKKSDHIHKHLVDKFNLECGSGFGIKFTNLIKSSAEHLRINAFENIS